MSRMMAALGAQPVDVGGPVAVLMGLGLPEAGHADHARDRAAKASEHASAALQAAEAGDCPAAWPALHDASLAIGALHAHVLSAGPGGGAIARSAEAGYERAMSEVVRLCSGRQPVRRLLRPVSVGARPEAHGGSPVARHIARQWQVLERSGAAAVTALDANDCAAADGHLIAAGQAAEALRYAAREASAQPPEMRAVMPSQEEYERARGALDAVESRFIKVCVSSKPRPTPRRRADGGRSESGESQGGGGRLEF